MNDLMILSVDEELRENPGEIGAIIAAVAADIENCKADISKIKDRNWFERLFNNNTRDLADQMLKQQNTISVFLWIVQQLMFLNMNNTVLLAAVLEKIDVEVEDRGLFQNEYIKTARDFLQETLTAAKKTDKKFKDTDKQLRLVKEHIRELYDDHESLEKKESKDVKTIKNSIKNIENNRKIDMVKINNLINIIWALSIIEIIIIVYILLNIFLLKQ